MKRPLSHSFYHRGMEQHSNWKPTNLNQLELLIKTSALFSRSLVLPDSDVNNHSLLSQVTGGRKASILEQAIQSGFVRRAARFENDEGGDILSQSKLFEQFSKNNEALAKAIPSSHPRRLDRLFAQAEKENAPPVWKLRDAAELFGYRMLFEFQRAHLSKKGRRLAEKIKKYILELPDMKDLRGGIVAKKYLSNREKDVDQNQLWLLLQESYNGNVVGSFDGNLAVVENPNGDPAKLPAGPVPDAEEELFTKEFYLNSQLANVEELYEIGVGQVSAFEGKSPNFYLNLEKLLDLDLQEIEVLREEAQPDNYFDVRFQALGNGREYRRYRNKLHKERSQYWERLEKAGVTLWKKESRDEIRYFREIFIGGRLTEKQRAFEKETREFFGNVLAEITQAGILSLLIDLVSAADLSKKIQDAKEQKGDLYKELKNDTKFMFTNDVLKRPDFRVVKKLISM